MYAHRNSQASENTDSWASHNPIKFGLRTTFWEPLPYSKLVQMLDSKNEKLAIVISNNDPDQSSF